MQTVGLKGYRLGSLWLPLEILEYESLLISAQKKGTNKLGSSQIDVLFDDIGAVRRSADASAAAGSMAAVWWIPRRRRSPVIETPARSEKARSSERAFLVCHRGVGGSPVSVRKPIVLFGLSCLANLQIFHSKRLACRVVPAKDLWDILTCA
jgi:hypothetical protein